jgi:hypothetical protein
VQILRVRSGFQADHSSSSHLFYAVDKPVSARGQQVAHRFSSHADVDDRYASYQKWGESSLSSNAFPALLGEHYDVMASESYDSWTLMIAVPRTPQREALLQPFHDLADGEFQRIAVHTYPRRLAIELYCEFDYEGPLFQRGNEPLESLVDVLADIRAEILQGNVSFLNAVAQFYQAGAEDEEGAEEGETEVPAEPPAAWTKAELQQECRRRGIPVRQALASAALPPAGASRAAVRQTRKGKAPKLSRAARRIVDSLTHV